MNWQAEFERQSFEPLSRASAGASVCLAVLAAHPDDESIGASLLLARCPNARIIFVTDGAPRDRRLWPETIAGTRGQYAAIRRQEAERALAHAGIPRRQITWLGGVDQEASIALRPLRMHIPRFEMTSYHACNRRLVTGQFLGSNPAEEWRLELSAEDKTRKRKMFEEYPSQQAVLKSFGMDCEQFRVAPAYDFHQPPHEGKLWYECLGWPMSGERWRA